MTSKRTLMSHVSYDMKYNIADGQQQIQHEQAIENEIKENSVQKKKSSMKKTNSKKLKKRRKMKSKKKSKSRKEMESKSDKGSSKTVKSPVEKARILYEQRTNGLTIPTSTMTSIIQSSSTSNDTLTVTESDIHVNEIESKSFNQIFTREKTLAKMLPQLKDLEQRINKTYKYTKTHGFAFFDSMLMMSQRYVQSLITATYKQLDTLVKASQRVTYEPSKSNKRSAIPSSSAKLIRKNNINVMNDNEMNYLLDKTDKMKDKIDLTLKELTQALDEFTNDFKLAI